MEKKDLINYEGNKVKIILQNDYYYICIIKEVGDQHLKITDKRNVTLFIDMKDIKLMEVLG